MNYGWQGTKQTFFGVTYTHINIYTYGRNQALNPLITNDVYRRRPTLTQLMSTYTSKHTFTTTFFPFPLCSRLHRSLHIILT